MMKTNNITCNKKDSLRGEERLFGLAPRNIEAMCQGFARLGKMLAQKDPSDPQNAAQAGIHFVF